MIPVDTNVLLDIATKDPTWAHWSVENLDAAAILGQVVGDAVICSEFPAGYDRNEDVERLLSDVGIGWAEIPSEALFLAGEASLAYRRQGGGRTGVLPDFFVGADAAVSGTTLLTRDVGRYRTCFPHVRRIAPQ